MMHLHRFDLVFHIVSTSIYINTRYLAKPGTDIVNTVGLATEYEAAASIQL